MPIVTLAPILADPIDNSRQSATEINPFLFVKGSLIYQVLADSNTSTPAIFKSTAAGVNSVALDAANAPAYRSGGAMICYSDPSSSIISIAYRDTGSFNLAIVAFDTATDTYGTPIISTLNSGTAFAAGIGLFQRSGSGLYYVAYSVGGQLTYRTINGAGTTSAAVTMTPAVSAGQGMFYTKFDEATGIAFFFYLVSAASGHFNCITLSAADVVGSPVTISTDGVEWVEAVISSGTISAAWINNDGSKVETASATVATAPTFSAATTLATYVAPEVATYISITYIASVLTVLWCSTDLSFNPGVDEIEYSEFVSAAWTTPAAFYDAIANPPAGGLPYPNQFVHTLQVIGISGGWFGFTAMETGDCVGFILVAPGIGLTLPCPLAAPGTVGMPFTETLIASGGVPPYAYAVVAGYSLPPGLTLDPTTGIISGTPTIAGTFNIAFMVTDSVGTVATTMGTCPIPISGPPGAPCSNAVTNPALDSYLELRKVLVAWKKETHLPIRGKS